jgi:hypothetical protein
MLNIIQAELPSYSLLTQQIEEYGAGEKSLELKLKGRFRSYKSTEHLSYLICNFYYRHSLPNKDLFFKVINDIAEEFEYKLFHDESKSKYDLVVAILYLDWSRLFYDPQAFRNGLKALQSVNRLFPEMKNFKSERFQRYEQVKLVFQVTQMTQDQFPHQRYIGVGYKDKGSSRKFSQAEDASPGWQEVAMAKNETLGDRIVPERTKRSKAFRRLTKFLNGRDYEVDRLKRLRNWQREKRDYLLDIFD